jgi:primosomal protein N'
MYVLGSGRKEFAKLFKSLTPNLKRAETNLLNLEWNGYTQMMCRDCTVYYKSTNVDGTVFG